MQFAAPRHPLRRLAAWLALAAVATLLWGPLAPASAQAHARAQGPAHGPSMAGCAMMAGGPASATPSAPPAHHADLCAAACALCGQLWAAPAPAADAPGRVAARVSYARTDIRLEGIAPARATPPPR